MALKPISTLVESAAKTVSGVAVDQSKPAITKKCHVCECDFEVEPGPFEKYVVDCDDCVDKRTVQESKQAAAQANSERKSEWELFCPPEYRVLVIDRLPLPHKLQEVMKWRFGPKGLMLHGETGKGKTRCAWALLEREFQTGCTLQVMDSMAGLIYAARFSESAAVAEAWIKKFIAADILFMDDIFKVKLTDSFEGIVFTLVDQRIQKQKPTIITSNDTGKTLEARLTQDRAAPLLRRLRECCQQINF